MDTQRYLRNLRQVQERIARACNAADRSPESITLIAVSKSQPTDAISALYDLGVHNFGESRLQEALPKISRLPTDITWHFVGKLQSNKAKKAAELFKILHSLESETQLREIEKGSHLVDCLIEVNTADEVQKSGIAPGKVDEYRRVVLQCRNTRYRGLMTVGPAFDDSERMRPYFRKLAELKRQVGGDWLSMGMSGDFDVGIQEGATHIRVGTALFGARQ